MKVKIRLDTQSDVAKFVNIASKIDASVHLTDGQHFKVSGKSLLGAIYTMEWDEVYCECDKDIYSLIDDFIIIE
jgi:hypothetical protein